MSTWTTLIRLRNETFDFPIGPSIPKLYVSIFDHKTLGKDKSLGDAEVSVSNKYAFSRQALTHRHFRYGNIYSRYPTLLPTSLWKSRMAMASFRYDSPSALKLLSVVNQVSLHLIIMVQVLSRRPRDSV